MHQFDALERSPGRAEGLEPQHGPDDSFRSPLVLFHPIIQLLDLTHHDGGARLLLECIKRCGVGAALVDGFLEEAPGGLLVAMGGEQEVDGLSLLVDRAIEVFPQTLN